MTSIARRALLVLALLAVVWPRPALADPANELRIGYRKIGVLLALKGQGALEKRFAAQGIKVTWVEFSSGPFFLASRTFAQANPAIVSGVIDEARKVAKWAQGHQAEYARVLADASGVDLSAEKVAVGRGDYEIVPPNAAIVAQGQAIADTFAKLGLLPHPVVVRANVWTADGNVAAVLR